MKSSVMRNKTPTIAFIDDGICTSTSFEDLPAYFNCFTADENGVLISVPTISS